MSSTRSVDPSPTVILFMIRVSLLDLCATRLRPGVRSRLGLPSQSPIQPNIAAYLHHYDCQPHGGERGQGQTGPGSGTEVGWVMPIKG